MPDDVIREIAGWLGVGDLVRLASTNKRIREATARFLFKTVCFSPFPGTRERRERWTPEPPDLSEHHALHVKTLVCRVDRELSEDYNTGAAIKAITKCKNVKCLIIEGTATECEVLDAIVTSVGRLGVAPFGELKWLDLYSFSPGRLMPLNLKNVVHLSLRMLHRDNPLDPLFPEHFPNLRTLSLDEYSLVSLWVREDGLRLCGMVKRMRIAWDNDTLMSIGTKFVTFCFVSRGLIPWTTDGIPEPFRLPWITHLHMDIAQGAVWGIEDGICVALRNLVILCREMSSELRELVIWVGEQLSGGPGNYQWLAEMLPDTFLNTEALPRLRGVTIFLELENDFAVEEFQRGMRAKTNLRTRLLERDIDDNKMRNDYEAPTPFGEKKPRWPTPIVITEGEAFGCDCDWKESMLRGYAIRYFRDHGL